MYANSKTISEIQITKGQLEQWYLVEKFSTRDIAKKLGTSQPTARKILAQNGIQSRTYKDNKTPIPKGGKMPEGQKKAIGEAMIGNKNSLGIRRAERRMTNCGHCGKEIEERVKYLDLVNKTFCSEECDREWRKIAFAGENSPVFNSKYIPCKQCENIVLSPLHRIKKNDSHGIFCSRACHSLWRSLNVTGARLYNFKGGYDEYYGESWPGAQRLARERDKNICKNCFITAKQLGKNMDVHHIIPFREFGAVHHIAANNLNNLICYCNVCHKMIEEAENKLRDISLFAHDMYSFLS